MALGIRTIFGSLVRLRGKDPPRAGIRYLVEAVVSASNEEIV
jgi:hypothetical protein